MWTKEQIIICLKIQKDNYMGRIIYKCTDCSACGSGILDGTLYAINEYAIGYYNDG